MKRMWSDFALGLRLAFGSFRGKSLVRLGLGGFVIGLAVVPMFVLASAGTVGEEQEARRAAQMVDSRPRDGVAPTLVRGILVEFRGRPVSGALIQHSDDTSPVPVGVPRQLRAGEMVVSSALAELLAEPDSEPFRERFAGYRIIGEIGQEGVVQRQSLRFVAASDSVNDFSGDGFSNSTGGYVRGKDLRDIPADRAQEAYAFGGPVWSSSTPEWTSDLWTPSVVWLAAILVIVASGSSRMAANQRAQRLATLRLIGAGASQVRRVAAAEAAVLAATGVLVGAGLFLLLRPLADTVTVFGVAVFADDLVPAWWGVALIVLIVPLLAALSVLLGMRNAVVEPLGVVRRGVPMRALSPWLGVLAILVGMALIAVWDGDILDPSPVERGVVGGLLIVAGIGLLLYRSVKFAAGRIRGGSPSMQLAVRRLQLDSAAHTGFHESIGMVLAGAIALLVVLTSQFRSGDSWDESSIIDLGRAPSVPMAETDVTSSGEHAEFARRLAGVVGEDAVHPSIDLVTTDREDDVQIRIGDCVVLREVTRLDRCADGDVYITGAAATAVSPGDRLNAGGLTWRIPENARRLSDDGGDAGTAKIVVEEDVLGVLATPEAFPEAFTASSGRAQFYLDVEQADALAAAEFETTVRALFAIERRVWMDRPAHLAPYLGGEQWRMDQVRSWLLAGALILGIIVFALGFLLAVDYIRQDRRAFAAASATGVGFGTLARSLLWQNLIPFGVNAVLGIGGGLVLALFVLRISAVDPVVDWASIGVLFAGAAALVLIVTALSLPMLRAAVSVRNLRTE